jgi:hypothetical protein
MSAAGSSLAERDRAAAAIRAGQSAQRGTERQHCLFTPPPLRPVI